MLRRSYCYPHDVVNKIYLRLERCLNLGSAGNLTRVRVVDHSLDVRIQIIRIMRVEQAKYSGAISWEIVGWRCSKLPDSMEENDYPGKLINLQVLHRRRR